MLTDHYHFDEITLLITHYNRSKSLERQLTAFKELNCTFEEVIVTDDGSKPEHLLKLQELQQIFSFRLLTTPVNKGLGNNNNKGQDAVKSTYTLYVQEDFVPTSKFPEVFVRSVKLIKEQSDLDIIRFYSYFLYPYLKPFDNEFSLLDFHGAPWYANHRKFYFYSDHPHLRRSNFFEKFGRYKEGVRGDYTEYRMSLSLIQKKAKGIFYTKFNELFEQKNTSDEPSTMLDERPDWKLSPNPLVRTMRFFYLIFKFSRWSLDLVFIH